VRSERQTEREREREREHLVFGLLAKTMIIPNPQQIVDALGIL